MLILVKLKDEYLSTWRFDTSRAAESSLIIPPSPPRIGVAAELFGETRQGLSDGGLHRLKYG